MLGLCLLFFLFLCPIYIPTQSIPLPSPPPRPRGRPRPQGGGGPKGCGRFLPGPSAGGPPGLWAGGRPRASRSEQKVRLFLQCPREGCIASISGHCSSCGFVWSEQKSCLCIRDGLLGYLSLSVSGSLVFSLSVSLSAIF